MGPERIAVAGGDGTIGPAAELAGRLGVPLAVIPTGTANDFARAHRAAADDPEARARWPPPARELRPLELGRLADGRPFVNVASAGLASVAARRARAAQVAASARSPTRVGALRAAATEQPLRCTVRVDGEQVFDGEAWQVIVAVTGAFGGGSEIGAADPERRRARRRDPPRRLAARRSPAAPGACAAARSPSSATSRHARGSVVEVDLPPGTEFNVDGEVRDRGLERITVEHRAYELVVG